MENILTAPFNNNGIGIHEILEDLALNGCLACQWVNEFYDLVRY